MTDQVVEGFDSVLAQFWAERALADWTIQTEITSDGVVKATISVTTTTHGMMRDKIATVAHSEKITIYGDNPVEVAEHVAIERAIKRLPVRKKS